MIRFTVYGEAKPAGSKRQVPVRRKVDGKWVHTGKMLVVDANPEAKVWKEEVRREAARAMQAAGFTSGLLEGALNLSLAFYRVRPKSHFGKRGLLPSAPSRPITIPDTTKLVRGIEDALTGIVWRDDAQVCDQFARKRYGEPARVEISVTRMGE